MSSGHSEGSRGSERSYYDDGGSSYEQDTQPCTQPQMLQPARARYLTDEDLIDSFCLIHPASYGAMLIVERTREYNPGIIVEGYDHMTAEGDSHDPRRKYKHDIALRMSTARNQFKEKGGWIFGRNPALCDVQLASFGNATTPQEKRISNKHFRIYVNGYGIVMLEDTSMNGTIVDGQLVHSRGKFGASKSRMLANGTTIQLQMDCQYPVTFIVWFPIRETKIEQLFVPRFKEWLYELIRDGVIANPSPIGAAGTRQPGAKEVAVRNDPTTIITVPTAFYQYESRWDGGKDYTVIDTIGSGAFATVYKVAAKSDGKVYACKEINKKHMMKNKHAGKILSHELKIMERLCHPNIVEFHDSRFVDDRYLYIMMEFIPYGELATWLHEAKKLDESDVRTIGRQILHALHYLHSENVTHRDVKPENILISSMNPLRVKLGDFGLSKIVDVDAEGGFAAGTFLKTFCGTLLYCAPEVYPGYDVYRKQEEESGALRSGKKRRRGVQPEDNKRPRTSPYDESVDMWSYGAVMFHLLTGSPPFAPQSGDKTGSAMLNKLMTEPPEMQRMQQAGVSAQGQDFVRRILQRYPETRPNEATMLQHDWFGPVKDEFNYNSYIQKAKQEKGKPPMDTIPEFEERQRKSLPPAALTPQTLAKAPARTPATIPASIPAGQGRSNVPSPSLTLAVSAKQAVGTEPRSRAGSVQSRTCDASVQTQIETARHAAKRGSPVHSDEDAERRETPQKVIKRQKTGDGQAVARRTSTEDDDAPAVTSARAMRSMSGNRQLRGRAQGVEIGSPSPLNWSRAPVPSTPSRAPAKEMASTPDERSSPNEWKSSAVKDVHASAKAARTAPLGKLHPSPAVARTRRYAVAPDGSYTYGNGDSDGLTQQQSSRGHPIFSFGPSPMITSSLGLKQAECDKGLSIRRSMLMSLSDGGSDAGDADEDLPPPPTDAAKEVEDEDSIAGEDEERQVDYSASSSTTESKIIEAEREFTKLCRKIAEPKPPALLPVGTMLSSPAACNRIPVKSREELEKERQQADAKIKKNPSPSSPVVGRLIPVKGSFYKETIDLRFRLTSWGRGLNTDQRYYNVHDDRVPKYALEIAFWAPGIEQKVANGEDWRKMDNVCTILSTRTTGRIYVNNVSLTKETEDGEARYFGKIYSGDKITVYKDKHSFLAFTCVFFHGEAMMGRPVQERPFKVQTAKYPVDYPRNLLDRGPSGSNTTFYGTGPDGRPAKFTTDFDGKRYIHQTAPDNPNEHWLFTFRGEIG